MAATTTTCRIPATPFSGETLLAKCRTACRIGSNTRAIASEIPAERRNQVKKLPIIGLLIGALAAMFAMKKRKGGSEEEEETPSTEDSTSA